METAISRLFDIRKCIIVPNISWGFVNHECDLFVISKTGLASEVEIKRSKSDFMADFKKDHKHLDSKIAYFYYAFPEYIYDKCKDMIPEHAGIIIVRKYESGFGVRVQASFERPAARRKNYRKLTEAEQLKVARLGCMRIYSLKMKLIGQDEKLQEQTE